MNLLSVSSVFGTIGSVLLAILILLAMITVHEFGHYMAGKALGFKIDEFSIGFGPALLKHRKRNGELFSVRAVPLGGYCAFAGESGEETSAPSPFEECEKAAAQPEKKATFTSKPPWQRIIVLISGALMNYITAVVLIIVSFLAFGQMVVCINGVQYTEDYTVANSFVAGDVILEAEGRGIYLTSDLMEALSGKDEGELARFKVERGGKVTEIYVALRRDCHFKNSSQTSVLWSALGVDTEVRADGNAYWQVSTVSRRFPFFESVGRSFAYSFKIAGTIFRVLGELLDDARYMRELYPLFEEGANGHLTRGIHCARQSAALPSAVYRYIKTGELFPLQRGKVKGENLIKVQRRTKKRQPFRIGKRKLYGQFHCGI